MTLKPKEAPLSEAVERLRARLDQLQAYLNGENDAISRVANAPETTLEDATERARQYWDKLEAKARRSVPPRSL